MAETNLNQITFAELKQHFLSGHYELVSEFSEDLQHPFFQNHPELCIYVLWSTATLKGLVTTEQLIVRYQEMSWFSDHPELQAHIQLWETARSAHFSGQIKELESLLQSGESSLLFQAIYYQSFYQMSLNVLDFESALDALCKSLKYAELMKHTSLALSNKLKLAQLHYTLMNLDSSLHYVKEAMQDVKQYQIQETSKLLNVCALLLQIHYATNETQHYGPFLDKWEKLFLQQKHFAMSSIYFSVFETMLHMGEEKRFKRLLNEVELWAQKSQYMHILELTRQSLSSLYQLKSAIKHNNKHELQRLHKEHLAYLEKSSQHLSLQFTDYSRLFLLQFHLEDFAQALKTLQELEQKVAIPPKSTLETVHLNHLAAVHEALGNQDKAKKILLELLYRIQETGCIRIFTDYYPGKQQIISEIFKDAQNNSFNESFVTSLSKLLNLPTTETATLSEREHEIALLLAQGQSNQEISEQLFISVNTVKYHVKNIFQKLDVKKRQEAVNALYEQGFMKN